MLSVGQSHTPGTFMGFFLSEVAGIVMAIVMLQNKVFSKVSAYVGILGFGLLLIFEICSSFVPRLAGVAMIFAMGGGLLAITWYILIAQRLFQLGQDNSKKDMDRDWRTVLGTRQPSFIFAEPTLGETTMSNKIFVTYASRTCSTAGVAEAISQTLAESGVLWSKRLHRRAQQSGGERV
jgi:hypothetical protein